MRRNPFKTYKGFVKGYIASTLAYKYQIFGWVLGSFLTAIITCVLWYAIFEQSSDAVINGYTFKEMLLYVITTKVVVSLTTSSQSFYDIGEDIRMGNIAITLTKPINYRARFLFNTFGSYIANFFIVFLPLYIITLLTLHFGFGCEIPLWYNFFFFFISSILSCILYDAFNFLIGQIAFYTGALFGVMLIKDSVLSFLSGGLIPLAFLPIWAQETLRILPFSSLTETPIYMLMNNYLPLDSLCKIGIQFGWVILFEIICYVSNRRIIKRVTSAGG